MTTITIYDTDSERIKRICERFSLTESEVIEMILDSIEGNEEEVF